MGVIAETRTGKIKGIEQNGVNVFRGIPFAAPPVGKLRFQAPQHPAPWSGVRDATRFGPSAPQDTMPGMEVGPQSEDCLYLNVWTPAADNKCRPVMVWIHGGGFMGGSGSQEMYEATSLARSGDVTVVTINYRLGALGFLYPASLLGESFPSTPNAGILDQIAALEWVRDNIGNFGGDPGNVTIFGESAGGMSTAVLFGMERSKGLFHRAIPQSGAAHNVCQLEDARAVVERFLHEANVSPSQPQRLLELTPEEIRTAQRRTASLTVNHNVKDRLPLAGMVFVPVVDGKIISQQPLEAVRTGLSANVPLMIGTNLDEWAFFIQFTEVKKKNLDEAGLFKVLSKRLGDTTTMRAEQAVAVYRKGRPDSKPVDIYCAFESDRIFRIPAIRLAEAHAPHSAPTWKYLFTWASPMMGGLLKSCHALEIPFVFGNGDSQFGKLFTGGGEAAKPLTRTMQSAWLAFARTGNPASTDLPDWPSYDTTRRSTMEFGSRVRVVNDPLPEERRFWDGIL
ncbi:MAG: carboxylesterase/lipase family protein [Deltaproteobacteria bacterium]|nr:carboxylesterase/lipase family protein [Deltaproteobacteria bacterium]